MLATPVVTIFTQEKSNSCAIKTEKVYLGRCIHLNKTVKVKNYNIHHTGHLLHGLQPEIYQRNWPTGLLLTPPSQASPSSNWSTHPANLAHPGSQNDTTSYLSFNRHLNSLFIIHADGSATAGALNGGAGMVVTEREPANPTTLLTKQQRAATIASSYDEEEVAMRMMLEWLLPSHAAVAICTDSQPLLKAIQSGSADTADLMRMLNKRADKTALLWTPGHHGIASNEADACVKQAAAITNAAPRPVSFTAASALIHITLTDPPPCHCRTK